MFNTKYSIKYSGKYTNSCYLLFFSHNFKLKTEIIIVELNKVGVTLSERDILPSHIAEFLLQKI